LLTRSESLEEISSRLFSIDVLKQGNLDLQH